MDELNEELIFEQLIERMRFNELDLQYLYEKNKTASVDITDDIKLVVKGEFYNYRVVVTIIETGKPNKTINVSMGVKFYWRIGLPSRH